MQKPEENNQKATVLTWCHVCSKFQ